MSLALKGHGTMFKQEGQTLVRKLNKNASVVLLCGIFMFISVLMCMSICSMPCEYTSMENKLIHQKMRQAVVISKSNSDSIVTTNVKPYQAFLVILLLVGPNQYEERKTIRQTWLSQTPKDVLNYFVLGTKNLATAERQHLEVENKEHHDLLLLDTFQDSYHALTKKILEAYKWLDANVDFQFVFKGDDDTFVHVDALLRELRQKPPHLLYWGFFDGRARVKRRSRKWAENKWVLCDRYLPHALGGGYVLSSDLVHFLALNSELLTLYNSEDVSVGTWLAPLDIHRVHDPRFDTEYKSRGCFNEYIVTHKQDRQMMHEKHEQLQRTGRLCASEYRIYLSYKYNWQVLPSKCCIRNDSSIP